MAPPPLTLPRRSYHWRVVHGFQKCQFDWCFSFAGDAGDKVTGHSAAAGCCSYRKQGNAIGGCGLLLQVQRAITRSAFFLLYAVLVLHCATRLLSLLQACLLWLVPCFLCIFGFCCL